MRWLSKNLGPLREKIFLGQADPTPRWGHTPPSCGPVPAAPSTIPACQYSCCSLSVPSGWHQTLSGLNSQKAEGDGVVRVLLVHVTSISPPPSHSLTRSLPQPNFAPQPRKPTLFWAVGICTVTGGLSFSSRVSRRVSPMVPGWRVARANTHTVTPDTQDVPRVISAVTKNSLPCLLHAIPVHHSRQLLEDFPGHWSSKVLSLTLTAPCSQRPCFVFICVPTETNNHYPPPLPTYSEALKSSVNMFRVSIGRPMTLEPTYP